MMSRPSRDVRPILAITEIKKKFGYQYVLKGVTFNLEKGRQTLLLGKNGAGKSTLLRILTGLMRPLAGSIKLNQVEISQNPNQLRRLIGVIFHTSQFYKELTARENLTFFSKLRAIQNLRTKIEHALEQTGLIRFATVPVKNFSSGMLKRLSIARLIVVQPQILLLDEPYTGLDYDSTNFLNAYLKQFKADGGAVLMVSHQIKTCFDNSDAILILEKGVIENRYRCSDLSFSELIRKYQNVTV